MYIYIYMCVCVHVCACNSIFSYRSVAMLFLLHKSNAEDFGNK